MEIIFATNNAHKLSEVQAVLGDGFRLVTPRRCGIDEEIPETGETLEANASQKSHYLHERTAATASPTIPDLRSRPLAAPRAYTRPAMPPTATILQPTTACC